MKFAECKQNICFPTFHALFDDNDENCSVGTKHIKCRWANRFSYDNTNVDEKLPHPPTK